MTIQPRFRLLTLLLVVAGICTALAWVRHQADRQEQLAARLESIAGAAHLQPYASSWFREQIGLRYLQTLHGISVPRNLVTPSLEVLREFPEVRRVSVNGFQNCIYDGDSCYFPDEREKQAFADIQRQIAAVDPSIVVMPTYSRSNGKLQAGSIDYDLLEKLLSDPVNTALGGNFQLSARVGVPYWRATVDIDEHQFAVWAFHSENGNIPGGFGLTILLLEGDRLLDVRSYSGLSYWAMARPQLDDFNADGVPDLVIHARGG